MGRHGDDDDTNASRGCQRVGVVAVSDATSHSRQRAQDGRFIAEDNGLRTGCGDAMVAKATVAARMLHRRCQRARTGSQGGAMSRRDEHARDGRHIADVNVTGMAEATR